MTIIANIILVRQTQWFKLNLNKLIKLSKIADDFIGNKCYFCRLILFNFIIGFNI